MEITKREIVASISIIAIMLCIGLLISGKISDWQLDQNEKYNKAVKINDAELFQYGMDTSVGNAFVYGDLRAVDTVTFDEIGGAYLYAEKIKERYERHEEWVTKKDADGKEHREKKVWYEWETESREDKHVDEIEFCRVVFPYGKVKLPGAIHIDTINGGMEWSWKSGENVNVRFRYYGVSTEHTGTIYTRLVDGTISDNSQFFEDRTIDQALESCTSGIGNAIFWVFWIVLICGVVFGFCYLENRWLED